MEIKLNFFEQLLFVFNHKLWFMLLSNSMSGFS